MMAKDADGTENLFVALQQTYAGLRPIAKAFGFTGVELDDSFTDFMKESAVTTRFGRAVLAHILADRYFFQNEDSPEWCALLERFGYAQCQVYDPDLHGEIEGPEPGDGVWIFTDAMKDAAKGKE
jgi:hypothetical protein